MLNLKQVKKLNKKELRYDLIITKTNLTLLSSLQQQDRANQNFVTKAKASAEAKQIEVGATLEAAKLEAEAIRIRAAAESEASQLKTQAAEKEALLLDKYKAYADLRKAEILAKAMSGIRTAVLPSSSVPLFNFSGSTNVAESLATMIQQAVPADKHK